jgi:hypothetical protein
MEGNVIMKVSKLNAAEVIEEAETDGIRIAIEDCRLRIPRLHPPLSSSDHAASARASAQGSAG